MLLKIRLLLYFSFYVFQIIRRSNIEEKYLALVRHRAGHFCETAWIIIGLVAWEGVPMNQADDLYDFLCTTLPAHGNETERRCGTNDRYGKCLRSSLSTFVCKS